MKVLLVEDHKCVAEVSCDILREIYGHEVVHASTVAEALVAIAEHDFDLGLIDINLPDGDGRQLAQEIRALPKCDGMVLVALTGIGGLVDSANLAAAGFDSSFTKPMDFAILPELAQKSPHRISG